MKVTLKDLWETGGALERLAAIEFDDERIAYRLGRIHDAVMSELKPLQKSHQRLIRKLGQEIASADGQGTGNYYMPAGSEAEDAYDQEWGEILAAEIEIKWDGFTIDQLKAAIGKDGKLPLAPRDLGALSRWLINE